MPIRLSNPVNRNHPLNRGVVAWWLTLPGWDGGAFWYDLLGLYPAALTSMNNRSTNGWRSTTRPGGWGHLQFDQVAACVQPPNAAALDIETLSIAAWINTPGTGGAQVIVSNFFGAGASIRATCDILLNGTTVFLQCSDGTTTPFFSGTTAVNTWTRVVATRVAKGAMVLYANGKQIGSGTDTTTGSTLSSVAPNIGRRPTATNLFIGSMDDVRIWNRALSAAEVKADYDLSRSGYPGLLNRIVYRAPAPVASKLFRRTVFDRVGSRSAA